ncbi:XRE family transcriptional regulator [Streptomyces sp. PSKA54]|uniref:XRE family transcriptional regulator n=1 Tax=Streptomyces himalayensis subsp. aureolus TaxID=2758039 RepID=A0A7W2HJB6_9ACTN|nr:XRE family transcriptional regulator [Streptomyces himalayensis]MBA4865980.1 XRE family transcriptional regulator [Streptomyces himalayensis subsp. aureolus]
MTNLIRKCDGKPLRAAMKRRGLSAPKLAAATKDVDVTGRGISPATVYKVTGSGPSATDECRLRTAWLLTTAMDEPLQEHFDMPSVSTDTVERSTPHGDADPR